MMASQDLMIRYYERRQPEYEAVYAKPERQEDLAWLEEGLLRLVAGRRVLELACGTGYWTRRMAPVAASVHATDASAQLAAAALDSCAAGNVTTATLDAYDIPSSPEVDCVVAGFLYSHVSVAKRRPLLAGIAEAVRAGTRVVLFDNCHVEGSNTPIARRTAEGDTYQHRTLEDGSSHEVLKNFPRADELEALFGEFFGEVSVEESRYYWLAWGF
jgi:demethylmenaquinone methyltransferase/2-methoxy-6-polyprenyl-1,4-benzoquinol methylase